MSLLYAIGIVLAAVWGLELLAVIVLWLRANGSNASSSPASRTSIE